MATDLENDAPAVRRADLIPDLKYEEMSPLGKKLYEIAKEIELSDEPEWNEEAIERELALRRGGFSSADEDSHPR